MRNRYAASAFNTCPHQPLQEMTGKPLDIVFVEGAVPVAVHTPVIVPHHWKADVKAGLDQDVDLGYHRAGASRHAHHLAEQDGSGTQEGWHPQEDRGPTEGQQRHTEGDAPHL